MLWNSSLRMHSVISYEPSPNCYNECVIKKNSKRKWNLAYNFSDFSELFCRYYTCIFIIIVIHKIHIYFTSVTCNFRKKILNFLFFNVCVSTPLCFKWPLISLFETVRWKTLVRLKQPPVNWFISKKFLTEKFLSTFSTTSLIYSRYSISK